MVSHRDLRVYTLALLLLWLALTGGYAGWKIPSFLLANLLAWAGLSIWLLYSLKYTRPDSIEIALLLFVAALISSAIAAGSWKAGLTRGVIWLGYTSVYRLAKGWPDEVIHQAALGALIPYALCSFFPWENSNIVAFNLVGLALLSGGWWIIGPVVAITMGWLNSLGSLIAANVALVFYARWPRWVLVGLVIIGPFGWLAWPDSYACRINFWVDAWDGFVSSPWWGIGPGQYYTVALDDWMHAHNIGATTAAEMGTIGLLALSWLTWQIARRFYSLPTWSAALVTAYAVWSMIDEPLQIWGAGFVFFVALSRLGPLEASDIEPGCPKLGQHLGLPGP